MARRLRLAFLDTKAANEALPKVIELMAKEFNWSEERQKQEKIATKHFLHKMTVGQEGIGTDETFAKA